MNSPKIIYDAAVSHMASQKVAIIGFGRVGLPLGLVLADSGFYTIGVDVNTHLVSTLQQKKLPFIEDKAEALLKKHYGKNLKVIHESFLEAVVHEVDYIIITLGTPLNDTYGPDFSQLDGVFEKIMPLLKKGQMIILRSTVSPGTTELIARRLEKRGYKVGKDIHIAYAPERIAEGKSIDELKEIPQIIGALTEACAKKAGDLFSKFAPEVKPTDPKSAELAKLYSNMYRYIDFAIGNEFMMIAEEHERDIYEILDLVNGGYKRAGLKSPGFTAGPCLVKDGFFLIDKGPYMELVTAAWRINENIPGFLLEQIKNKQKDLEGKKVAILGLAFKKEIDDTRYSLSYKLIRHFLSEGAEVYKHDPFVKSDELDEALDKAEVVIIATNHEYYKKIGLNKLLSQANPECIFCDIWNMFGTGKIIQLSSDLKKNTTNGEVKKTVKMQSKKHKAVHATI